jgi:D-inositol-3-phosphate glycosyltransferase
LKVILIGPAFPLRGGISNFNESLANAFLKRNIEAKIISFYFQYPSFLFPGKTQQSESKKDDSLIIKNLISSINPFSWIKTARYIRKSSPDLIVVQHWLPFMAPALGSVIRLVHRKLKIETIAVVHNAIPHEKKPGDHLLTSYFIKACNGFICLSKTVLEELSVFTSNRNKVFVPHPLYDIFGEKVPKAQARKFLDIDDSSRVILFFGIIRKYKGLKLLIESMATDKVRLLNLKLVVAGEFYDDKEEYVQLIEQYGLSANVLLCDKFITNENVKYYFCASDIVVQPYLSATQSGVTQIAYNFERPMLVTNVGGLAEIVDDKKTGYITEVKPGSIAGALCDFYENNREKEMSNQTANAKKRFSWNTLVDAILTLWVNNNKFMCALF